MSLTAGQIPKVANVINGGVGVLSASATTVVLGTDTNGVTIYTAGSSGGRVFSLTGVTDDTVIVNVYLWILRGATVIPLGLVQILGSSGNTNAVRYNVDFLDAVNIVGLAMDNVGKRFISLNANDVLRCGALANLTAAKKAWIQAQGADYQA